MKRGVEHGNLGRFGHQFVQHVDAGVGRRVVKRRQLLAFGQVVARLGVDDDRAREILAARDDAVSDRIDLAQAAHRRFDVLHHHLEQLGQAFLHPLARDVVARLLEVGGKRHVHERRVGSHLLGDAFHERHLAVGLDQLAFERRAAGVHHQHEHRSPFPICAHRIVRSIFHCTSELVGSRRMPRGIGKAQRALTVGKARSIYNNPLMRIHLGIIRPFAGILISCVKIDALSQLASPQNERNRKACPAPPRILSADTPAWARASTLG